jgi:hypothetical protein
MFRRRYLYPVLLAFIFPTGLMAQEAPASVADRLPRDVLDVMPPSERVDGEPGEMRVVDRTCRQFPEAQVRQRIVEITVQEWAWHGHSVIDMTLPETPNPNAPRTRPWWWSDWQTEEEAGRVADDIAGYWAAAPDSSWIVENQNQRWRENGITARWRDFWSAAFISWVMCESGLGEPQQFERAIAHHTYIDQAIRARDGQAPDAAFIAYDIGEAEIAPGDLLCRGSRPEYQNLAQRRSQMGEGARTHCDVVITINQEAGQIEVIGGNVRGSVRKKLLPGELGESGNFEPVPYQGRRIFSHLKLAG